MAITQASILNAHEVRYEDNIIGATDSYKLTHARQYPEGTEKVFSYFESRIGAEYPETVFFGLQMILAKYMEGVVVTEADIEIAEEICRTHFNNPDIFNKEGWEYILKYYGGRLPLHIRAVPEGTVVSTGNVLMTIENTDPKCFWLTNAVESLLTHLWYPCTVATRSRGVYLMLKGWVDKTSDAEVIDDIVRYMLQDFGYRGATTHDAGAIGGLAHLVNFNGSDTVPALLAAIEYYNAEDVVGASVPATEHSVMTSYGKEREFVLVDEILAKYPTGILSMVADSYDVYNFVDHLCSEFKHIILERDGKLVVRPDSGDPEEVMVELSKKLWDGFGGTTNSKGFKVLDPHVGLLWGDGIDPEGIEDILYACCENNGFAAENYVFGMGGGLLQKLNRDTQRFAFKCSAQMRDGKWLDIQKDPVGDHGKASKGGRLALLRNKSTGEYMTEKIGDSMHTGNSLAGDLLQSVFHNGSILNPIDFEEVRHNALQS